MVRYKEQNEICSFLKFESSFQVYVQYHTVANPSNIDNVDHGAEILASMPRLVAKKLIDRGADS